MSKTKEEILREEHSKIITNSDKIFRERPSLVLAAHNAMEVFAKQQAMAYFDWGIERMFPGSIPKELDESNMLARENLYKKFLELQNK